MRANRLAVLILALGLVPLAGCGGEKFAEVTGTVTLKNQPLASGVATFFPEQGEAVATFVKDGTYTIPSIAYGNYRISVAPTKDAPEVSQAGSGRKMKPGEVDPTAKGAAPKKPAGPPIPAKYHSADTSGLNCKVDQSRVTHPIALD